MKETAKEKTKTFTDRDLRRILFEESQKFIEENREEIVKRAHKRIRRLTKEG